MAFSNTMLIPFKNMLLTRCCRGEMGRVISRSEGPTYGSLYHEQVKIREEGVTQEETGPWGEGRKVSRSLRNVPSVPGSVPSTFLISFILSPTQPSELGIFIPILYR